MKIKSLKLTNFRNWPEKNLEFSDRILIYGPNAQGKTNILEALYIVATTRSFRGREVDVISKGSDFARIEAVVEKDKEISSEVILRKNGLKTEKEFRIAEKKRSGVDFIGEFSCIVFSPDDLLLISGPPELKRRYLSFTIGQNDREYLFNLLNYKKILRQRNELLRIGDQGMINEEIDIWDKNLAEYGQKVIEARLQLAEFINRKLSQYYQELSGDQKSLTFVYEPAILSEDLLESLKEVRKRDISERTTTVGPHRDSWRIEINGENAADFASRGEYRTIILALKLCERDWFATKSEEKPVVLLDDVFSELDSERRKYLVEAFLGSQIIITTTDLDHLDPSLQIGTQLVAINGEELRIKKQECSAEEIKEVV